MSLIGKGFTGVKNEESVQRNTTMAGSYGFGLTFAVGWSSCVGPILGVVLTMAATTDSVLRGMLLLFIYAMGLGLPLIIISTFFGRTSRKSLFWRILRGKGWDWTTHAMVVGIIWALAIWRILVAVVDYWITRTDPLAALSSGQEWGLLLVALVGVALWVYTQSGDKEMTVNLHSTQLVSGALFIFMGVLMLNGSLATFNSIVPEDLATWFADIEEGFTDAFQNRFEVEVPAIPASATGAIIDLNVTTENGLFQSGEWDTPVDFSIRQRSIADGVDVRLAGGEDPLKTTLVPPGKVSLEVNFISSVEANTRLFTLTGLGGGRFESIDFGYVCDDGGTCEIRQIDVLEFAAE
jgi:cytochrome c biogenesis protein CcdA